MIKLENISKTYYAGNIKTTALKSVEMEVSEGDFIIITGLSGSGKSTLLHILGTLDFPDEGKYFLRGREINNLKNRQIAKIRNKEMGFIFQSFNLIPELNVFENISLPLIYRGEGKKSIQDKVEIILYRVGLSNRREHFPYQLSGGQQQRVAIARALVGEPTLLLADEPTGNLDSKIGEEIINLIIRINKELKTTIVMVTHNQDLIKIGNKNFIMRDGMISELVSA